MKAILREATGNASLRSMKRARAVLILGALGAGVLLPFGGLGAQSSELPEGPGKAFALENCSGCHGVELVTAQRRSSEEWAEVVNRMIANGDTLTEDQYNEVVTYLGTYLGHAPVSGAAPASAPGASDTAPVARSAADDKPNSR